jgi:2-keto-4-pentenoate hydratase/2-oxohepta-3-ene-1,7-dioic acid hydratase in catechol pathway
MTDEEIVEIAKNVDAFLMKELDQYKINAIDLSAIVNSRLRMLSAASDMENDFDDLIDHLNSQTVVLPKILH